MLQELLCKLITYNAIPCKISSTDSRHPGAQNDHFVEKKLGFYKMNHLGGQICRVIRVVFEIFSKTIIYLGGLIL